MPRRKQLTPQEVEEINNDILPLMGEEEQTVRDGIKNATAKLTKLKNITSEPEIEKLNKTISSLLTKIQQIAEKIQNNTSKMIS